MSRLAAESGMPLALLASSEDAWKLGAARAFGCADPVAAGEVAALAGRHVALCEALYVRKTDH